MEQLQSLKQQLISLRKSVEQQMHLHEATAVRQAKMVHELEEVMEWLYSHESEVQSRPLLRIDMSSVLKEIEKHEVILDFFFFSLEKCTFLLNIFILQFVIFNRL